MNTASLMNRFLLLLLVVGCMSCKVAAPQFVNVKMAGKEDGQPLKVEVTVKNPNSFALKLKKVNLEIVYNDKVIGRAYINHKVRIAGKSTGTAPILLELEKLDMGTMMTGFLSRKNAVEFRGKVRCAAGIFPKTFRMKAGMALDLKDFM